METWLILAQHYTRPPLNSASFNLHLTPTDAIHLEFDRCQIFAVPIECQHAAHNRPPELAKLPGLACQQAAGHPNMVIPLTQPSSPRRPDAKLPRARDGMAAFTRLPSSPSRTLLSISHAGFPHTQRASCVRGFIKTMGHRDAKIGRAA